MIYHLVLFAFAALLSIAAIGLGVFSWRHPADRAPYYYLGAYTAVFLVACCAPMPVAVSYKAAVVLGLLLTMLAALLQQLLRAPTTLVHAFHLPVLLLYMAALAALHPLKWPTPWLLLPLFLGLLLYWALFPKLAELRSTLAVYAVALFLLSWQALEVVAVRPALWSWLALLGVLGLLVANSLAAIDQGYSTADAPLPTSATGTSSALLRRLYQITLTIQQRMLTVLERLALPAVARRSRVVRPWLLLGAQWLLAISVWGPALVTLLP
jgi:hypothetical protein